MQMRQSLNVGSWQELTFDLLLENVGNVPRAATGANRAWPGAVSLCRSYQGAFDRMRCWRG